jgi:hypothetical protein
MKTKQTTGICLALAALAWLGIACRDAQGRSPTEPGVSARSAEASLSRDGDDDDDDRRRGWLLGGTARLARDPENPANDVIRIRTDVEPFFGTVSRVVNVRIDKLDNMLEFKAWYETVPTTKTCIAGSPRFQLAVDTDGDGKSDGNIFLDTGIQGQGTGCPPNTWVYEDFTGGDGITGPGPFPSPPQVTPNEERECAAQQLGGPGVPGAGVPWSVCEEFFLATFPNHVVCAVALVDDTFGAPGMTGTAYYDVISGGRSTWVDRSDIAGRGTARCRRDRNDSDGDEDGDEGGGER